jgi:hypothetical protein
MQWWVVWWNPGASGSGAASTYKIVQGTRADAQNVANTAISATIAGPYSTQADAQAAASAGTKGSPAPAHNPNLGGVGNIGYNLPANPLSAVGDFLSRLTNPHTWLRVAEVVVGVAFLIVGLNALLHNPAGKVAGMAPVGRAVKAVRG